MTLAFSHSPLCVMFVLSQEIFRKAGVCARRSQLQYIPAGAAVNLQEEGGGQVGARGGALACFARINVDMCVCVYVLSLRIVAFCFTATTTVAWRLLRGGGRGCWKLRGEKLGSDVGHAPAKCFWSTVQQRDYLGMWLTVM